VELPLPLEYNKTSEKNSCVMSKLPAVHGIRIKREKGIAIPFSLYFLNLLIIN